MGRLSLFHYSGIKERLNPNLVRRTRLIADTIDITSVTVKLKEDQIFYSAQTSRPMPQLSYWDLQVGNWVNEDH